MANIGGGNKTSDWSLYDPNAVEPEIPLELQNTYWIHRDNDKISFGAKGVTAVPVTGIDRTYEIKEVSVSGSNTTLYFNLINKNADYITYSNNVIVTVNIGGINKTNNWTKYNPQNPGTQTVNGMKFEYSAEYGGYILTQYTGTDKNVVIPATVLGFPVKEIGGYVFRNKGLTGVTIPYNIVKIGEYAFAENELTSVIIPDSVTSLGQRCFLGFTSSDPNFIDVRNKLSNVVISQNITVIEISTFYNCPLTEINIPNKVTVINQGAFYGHSTINLVIPNSVAAIYNEAFRGNKKEYESITIGANVGIGLVVFPDDFITLYNSSNKAAGKYIYNSATKTWSKQ
jgi:hypothetical protein